MCVSVCVCESVRGWRGKHLLLLLRPLPLRLPLPPLRWRTRRRIPAWRIVLGRVAGVLRVVRGLLVLLLLMLRVLVSVCLRLAVVSLLRGVVLLLRRSLLRRSLLRRPLLRRPLLRGVGRCCRREGSLETRNAGYWAASSGSEERPKEHCSGAEVGSWGGS